MTRNGGFDAAVPTNSPEKAVSLARKRVSRAGSAHLKHAPIPRLAHPPDQTRPDQTRPDQTRPDQTRPDQTRHI